MFGKILDSIPGVGHAKGMWHYATRDPIAGDRAMYEATRSTAVVVGGAVGVLGGPAGMVAGAVAGGALADSVTSVVTGEAQGVVLGVADIATDISNGNVPIGSVVRTTLIVGTDIVGGLGGGSIGKCATKAITESAGKSLGKEIVKQVIKTEVGIITKSSLGHGTSRILVEAAESKSKRDKWESESSSSSSNGAASSSSTASSNGQSSGPSQPTNTSNESKAPEPPSSDGPGGQRPNNDQNSEKEEQHEEEKPESHWEAFFKIFRVKKLEEIILKGKGFSKKIFENLNAGQKKVLKTLIIAIRNSGYLDLKAIIDTTVELLLQLEQNDITFQNFQTVAKFVVAYVEEQIAQRNDAYRDTPRNFPDLSDTYDTRRKQLAEKVESEIAKSISALLDLLKGLSKKIKNLMTTVNPQFTNIFSAVYHYFKHKFISEKAKTFTPDEYFDLAREMLTRLYTLPRYQQLIDSGERRIVYERYYASIGRRVMIVLKIQAGIWKLASCYWPDEIGDDDSDGDEWINDEKLSRE